MKNGSGQVFWSTDGASHMMCEVGTSRLPACNIYIGGVMKAWPHTGKLGELLANTHFLGTLNYVNNIRKYIVYGMWNAVIKAIGFILLRMVVNETGYHVYFVH